MTLNQMKNNIYEKMSLLYPQNSGRENRRIIKKKIGIIVAGSCGIALLVILMLFAVEEDEQQSRLNSVEVLERNGYREGDRTYELVIEGFSEEKNHSFRVKEEMLGEEAAGEEIDRVVEELKMTILGENDSFLQIHYDLDLPDSYEGVKCVWISSAPDILSNSGRLKISEEEISEKVRDIVVILYASLENTERTYEIPLRIAYDVTEEEKEYAALVRAIEENEEKSRQEGSVTLPSEWAGREISYGYRREEKWSRGEILGGGILVFLLFLIALYNNLDEKMKKRKDEMELDYVIIVNKISAYLSAGEPVRTAWKKVCDDYRENGKEKRYAFEEMCAAQARINLGMPEIEVYREFSDRCRNMNYQHLAEKLENSILYGSSNSNCLREERVRANENRRNRAMGKAKEAETKMLFPMLLMFGIVVLILIIPAFVSFS